MVFEKRFYFMFSFVFLLRVELLTAQVFPVEKIAVGE